MDIDRAIAMAEKYLREFILFLISFFWRGNQTTEKDPLFEDLHRSVLFSIISALLGSYLWQRHVAGPGSEARELVDILAATIYFT